MHGMRSVSPTLVLLTALAACTSTAPPSQHQGAPLPPIADQRAAVPAHMTAERQWLSSWFKGTPVRIRQIDDVAITIDVPREFCFEPGRTTVKPALGAVLDKTTQSLGRIPLANVTLIAAPGDAPGTNALALQRAMQVQAHLRKAGVAAERLGKPTVASSAAVQLRIEASPL